MQLVGVLNAGSSSLKFSLYEPRDGTLAVVLQGQIGGIGTAPHFTARDGDGARVVDEGLAHVRSTGDALAHLFDWTAGQVGEAQFLAIGHRVVHGGPDFAAPVRIDDTVLAALDDLVPLAPLHQPHNLAPIRAIAARRPDVPQVACFDTAFHRGHPEVADRFAVPDELYRAGVRRYGFHGLSYEYVSGRLAELAPEAAAGRVVVAHLGSGASMCAIKAGHSIDSTMGFTALDSLPMGTRSGAIDPGVLLYLLTERGMDAKALEDFLYRDCGLKGLSGISNDMRDLEASEDPAAKRAIDYFVARIGRELGALSASLGGLDALVFTAGIGERSPSLRARVCRDAAWLGVALDDAANAAGGPRITTDGAAVSAWVIPTDEERMIARHTLRVLGFATAVEAA